MVTSEIHLLLSFRGSGLCNAVSWNALLKKIILPIYFIQSYCQFNELSNEFLNAKDVIIKNLQSDNERLGEKLSSLKNKVISLQKEPPEVFYEKKGS